MSDLSGLSHSNLFVGYPTPLEVVSTLSVSPFDTVTIDSVEEGGIKEVRHFIGTMQLAPQFGAVRLGVITVYDQLSVQAQNALLKLLEEPAQFALIVLFVSTISSVLPTIKSRCRTYYYSGNIVSHPSKIEPHTALERFVEAESLAKTEQVLVTVEGELHAVYTEWCSRGRQVESVQQVEIVWNLYHNLTSNTNKRILLEQYALES